MSVNYRSIAYHEAAHAIVALYFDHWVKVIRIVTDQPDKLHGECESLTLLDVLRAGHKRRRLAREHIIVTYAGFVAQRELLGETIDPLETYEDDRVENVMKMAKVGPRAATYVGDEHWQAYKRRLVVETTKIVRRYNNQIRAVAAVLSERGSLNGDEIRSIAGLSTSAS
jgi:ATP-dependent Zn protease